MFINIYMLLLLFSSLLTIIASNAMYSVFLLILTFLFASLIFLSLGVEFISLLILIIYVGAISILFLFVIMMLNLRSAELYNTFLNYFPAGGFFGFFILFELIYFFSFDLNPMTFFYTKDFMILNDWHSYLYYTSNILYVGSVLYLYFTHYVIIASLSLLIAMLGAIVLTVDFEYRSFNEKSTKKQEYMIRFVISNWL